MSQPDQVKVEDHKEAESNDEDSTMEDAGSTVDTLRTQSFALSDSQDASEKSTRASTPTETCTEDVSADLGSLKHREQDNVADDVTMKDIGAEKAPPAETADEFGNLKVVPWPSGNVIDTGTSLWKEEKMKETPMVEYDPDYHKFEDIVALNHPDAPHLYKP